LPDSYYIYKRTLLNHFRIFHKRLVPSRIESELLNRLWDPTRAVLFCFESENPSQVYRIQHTAKLVDRLGYTPVLIRLDQLEYLSRFNFLRNYSAIFLHRLELTSTVKRLISAARRFGTRIVLDLDDFIFDPAIYAMSGLFPRLNSIEIKLHMRMAENVRRTMDACDAVTVSTSILKQAVEDAGKPAFLLPNAVSDEMVKSFRISHDPSAGVEKSAVIMGYLSGTSTHDRDFDEIRPAVESVLETFPETGLVIAGPLLINTDFELRYKTRIQRKKLVNWEEVPKLYRLIDLNLAPLETQNPFCAAKSGIKFLEAGLLGIPTIASPVPAFCEIIRHSDNGFLAHSRSDWLKCLNMLISDRDLLHKTGAEAHHTTITYHHLDGNLRTVKTIFDWIESH